MTARRLAAILCASLAVATALRLVAPRPEIADLKSLHALAGHPEATQRPRRIYAYSVIPGGAYSRDELAVALRVDPVAAHHYAGFDAANASVERLSKDAYFYVSYRKADRVYWTANKRRIPKGELVLNDGAHLARTRCGNRLSGIPEAPVANGPQPAEMALNAPELPIELPEAPLLGPDYDAPAMQLADGGVREFALPVGMPAVRSLGEGFPAMGLGTPYMALVALPMGIRSRASEGNGSPGGSSGSGGGGSTETGLPPGGSLVPEPASVLLSVTGGLLLVILSLRMRARRARRSVVSL